MEHTSTACSNPNCTYSTCRAAREITATIDRLVKEVNSQPIVLVGGSVAAHFYNAFGRVSTDQTLNELETDSNCGADCVKVIDRARALIESITEAHGEKSHEGRQIIAIVDDVCQVFWRG